MSRNCVIFVVPKPLFPKWLFRNFYKKIKNILIEEFGKDYGIYLFCWLSHGEKTLEAKADVFLRVTGELKGYSLSYKGLSMEDM